MNIPRMQEFIQANLTALLGLNKPSADGFAPAITREQLKSALASVALTNTRLLDSSDQRHLLAARLLLASMEAGIVTAVEMLGAKEPQTNTLTAMGDAVSREVRRLLLLEVLEKNHWNLSKTAIDLRITAGAPAVSRLIRDLGLSDAYKSAKATGKVDPRGRRPT